MDPRADGDGHVAAVQDAPDVEPGGDEPHPGGGNGHERRERRERRDDEPPPKPPLRARVRRWRRQHPRGAVILVVAVVLALAAGVVLWWWLHVHESTDDAQIDGHIAPVGVRIAGTVTAVHVEDNQAVTAGQLLVELDPRDYEVALARAEAELAQARANLEAEHPNVPITATSNLTQVLTTGEDITTARAAVAAAERDAQAALARVHAAEATDARAQADLARNRFLIGQRAIAPQRFDEIAATAKAAHAELASQQATARAAQKAVDEQRARLQQALSRAGEAQKNAPHQLSIKQANTDAKTAAVKIAEANVARAKLDLDYTRITAPLAGVVGRRSAEPGQRVQPGEQLLAIVALDDLWVTANFKETQLRQLRIGQSVHVHVDALAAAIDGTVESFAGASGARYSLLPPENATGNFVKVVQRLPVRIKIAPDQDTKRRLRPGMSVVPRVRVH
jgi:membrane fusion protein, multidrug efflux system